MAIIRLSKEFLAMPKGEFYHTLKRTRKMKVKDIDANWKHYRMGDGDDNGSKKSADKPSE